MLAFLAQIPTSRSLDNPGAPRAKIGYARRLQDAAVESRGYRAVVEAVIHKLRHAANAPGVTGRGPLESCGRGPMYWPKGCSRTRRGDRAGSGLHTAGDAARGALRFCAIGANGVMRLSGENRRSGHLALCVGGSCRHQSSVAICSTSTQAVPESLAQTCSDQRRWGAACQRPFGASWRIYNACNSSCRPPFRHK